MVQQAPCLFHCDKQIEIASVVRVSPGRCPKDSDIARAVSSRNAKNVFPLLFQQIDDSRDRIPVSVPAGDVIGSVEVLPGDSSLRTKTPRSENRP